MRNFSFVFYFLLTINIVNADIINTSSFNNQNIGKIYNKTEPLRDFSYYGKSFSVDKKYTAINEDFKRIIIIDNESKIIFQYEWDDEIRTFPKSDTIYILGWSDNDNLWFFTYIPAEINYFAKADIKNKKLFMHDTKITDLVLNYVFDANNKILYYDNYSQMSYENRNNQQIVNIIYKYDIETKREEVLYRRKGGNSFRLKMEDGKLKFNK